MSTLSDPINRAALEALAIRVIQMLTKKVSDTTQLQDRMIEPLLQLPKTPKRLYLAFVLVDIVCKNYVFFKPLLDLIEQDLNLDGSRLVKKHIRIDRPGAPELLNAAYSYKTFGDFHAKVSLDIDNVFYASEGDVGRQIHLNLTQQKFLVLIVEMAGRTNEQGHKQRRFDVEDDLFGAVGTSLEDIVRLAAEEAAEIEAAEKARAGEDKRLVRAHENAFLRSSGV
ncbi:hypothetical protein LTR66_015871 [Elasticomyces elasticus]|nr:hypothetical protein LTR66_015871 [Elasticomyces elasticus]